MPKKDPKRESGYAHCRNETEKQLNASMTTYKAEKESRLIKYKRLKKKRKFLSEKKDFYSNLDSYTQGKKGVYCFYKKLENDLNICLEVQCEQIDLIILYFFEWLKIKIMKYYSEQLLYDDLFPNNNELLNFAIFIARYVTNIFFTGGVLERTIPDQNKLSEESIIIFLENECIGLEILDAIKKKNYYKDSALNDFLKKKFYNVLIKPAFKKYKYDNIKGNQPDGFVHYKDKPGQNSRVYGYRLIEQLTVQLRRLSEKDQKIFKGDDEMGEENLAIEQKTHSPVLQILQSNGLVKFDEEIITLVEVLSEPESLRDLVSKIARNPSEHGIKENGLYHKIIYLCEKNFLNEISLKKSSFEQELCHDIRKNPDSYITDEIEKDREYHLTALHWCAIFGFNDLSKALLDNGFPKEACEAGLQYIHAAILVGNYPFLECFLEGEEEQFVRSGLLDTFKLNITVGDEYKQLNVNMLFLIIVLGQPRLLQMALSKLSEKVDANLAGLGTYLHVAIYFENHQALRELLWHQYRGDVSSIQMLMTKDWKDRTPLMLAGEYGKIDMIKEIMQHLLFCNVPVQETQIIANAVMHTGINSIKPILSIQTFITCGFNLNKCDLNLEIVQKLEENKKKRALNILRRNTRLPFNKPNPKTQRYENLVFQGGGAKGLAYIYALAVLERTHELQNIHEQIQNNIVRVIGTSVGAMFAMTYALGYSATEMESKLDKDFNDFLEDSKIAKVLQSMKEETDNQKSKIDFDAQVLPILKELDEQLGEDVASLKKQADEIKSSSFMRAGQLAIFHGREMKKKFYSAIEKLKSVNEKFRGFSSGEEALKFIRALIKDKVESYGYNENLTFGELANLARKYPDKFKNLHVVVTPLDASNMPETINSEYGSYENYLVCDAVRASMSFPFAFAPHRLTMKINRRSNQLSIEKLSGEYIDGGVVRNYPIDEFDYKRYVAFDAEGDKDYPIFNPCTLGFRFQPKESKPLTSGDTVLGLVKRITGLFRNAEAVIGEIANTEYHRSIVLDTGDISTFSFKLFEKKDKISLLANAQKALESFFDTKLQTGIDKKQDEINQEQQKNTLNVSDLDSKQIKKLKEKIEKNLDKNASLRLVDGQSQYEIKFDVSSNKKKDKKREKVIDDYNKLFKIQSFLDLGYQCNKEKSGALIIRANTPEKIESLKNFLKEEMPEIEDNTSHPSLPSTSIILAALPLPLPSEKEGMRILAPQESQEKIYIGELDNGEKAYFQIHPTRGDGNCGFYALPIAGDLEGIRDLLLENIDKANIRKLIAPEIRDVVLSEHMPKNVADYDFYVRWLNKFKSLTDKQAIDKHDEKLVKYTQTKNACKAFINAGIGSKTRLAYYTQEENTSTLDAVAELANLRIFVYQTKEETNKLERKTVRGPREGTPLYLHHWSGYDTHFELMTVLDKNSAEYSRLPSSSFSNSPRKISTDKKKYIKDEQSLPKKEASSELSTSFHIEEEGDKLLVAAIIAREGIDKFRQLDDVKVQRDNLGYTTSDVQRCADKVLSLRKAGKQFRISDKMLNYLGARGALQSQVEGLRNSQPAKHKVLG